MRRLISAMMFFFLVLYPFSQAQAVCRPHADEMVTITSFGDDGSFMLDDGRALRLAGLDVPQGAAQISAWREIAAGFTRVPLTLSFPDRPKDRYGRLTALVGRGDGGMLQTALLAAGQARVMPIAGLGACGRDFLANEQAAREAGKGLWALKEYAPLDALDLAALRARVGDFVLVEGVVVAVAERAGRLFVNFEQDWRRDFTMTVERSDVRVFLQGLVGGDDEEAAALLVGKRIRVRGYLGRYNGPEIAVTLPEQVEILPEAASRE